VRPVWVRDRGEAFGELTSLTIADSSEPAAQATLALSRRPATVIPAGSSQPEYAGHKAGPMPSHRSSWTPSRLVGERKE
jgi:hypothetical protein